MNDRHVLHLELVNAHALLARVLLVFSRRRIRVRSLQFDDGAGDAPATLVIRVDGDEGAIDGVVRQLRRIVEVMSVRMEAAGQDAPREKASKRLAAA